MIKSETIIILITIAAVYQNFDVNQIKKDIWHELLKDTDYQFATKALIKTLKESKFAPTPAEIIERAGVEAFIAKSEGRLTLERIGDTGINGKN